MDPVLSRSLRSLAAAGVRRLPRALLAARSGAAPRSAGPAAVADDAAAASDARREHTEARFSALLDDRRPERPADPAAALARVAAEVVDCRACALCEGRTHAVPGEGAPDARVMFIGEGPGADEDASGRPFVGRAGKLLDDIITKGMKLQRADVYIANVVKCRPPNNRAPTPDESAACRDYLLRQIAAVSPAVICTLGATATHLLLESDLPMSRLRGREHRWRGVPVVPTYHPAYLLRSPAAKKPTWDDIQRVMRLAAHA